MGALITYIGIPTLLAWIKGRGLQLITGNAAAALGIVAAVVVVIGAVFWLKDSIVDAALSGRDLVWTRKIGVSNEAARQEQEKRDAGAIAAAEKARDLAAANYALTRARKAALERQIAAAADDPVCIPKSFWESKR